MSFLKADVVIELSKNISYFIIKVMQILSYSKTVLDSCLVSPSVNYASHFRERKVLLFGTGVVVRLKYVDIGQISVNRICHLQIPALRTSPMHWMQLWTPFGMAALN